MQTHGTKLTHSLAHTRTHTHAPMGGFLSQCKKKKSLRLKSAMILDCKEEKKNRTKEKETSATNQKHLNCKTSIGASVHVHVRVHAASFVSILVSQKEKRRGKKKRRRGGGRRRRGANLFIIMETIRENPRHMTTSKLKPYQRQKEGRRGGDKG